MPDRARVSSFPPVADGRSRVLILGSMPGVASLKAQQYYGNSRNYFWRIVYALFGESAPHERYEDRLRFALAHGIALWDSIASCERKGSLDSDIRDAVPNDIPGLLRQYPGIAVLACNGAQSHAVLLRHFGAAPEVMERTVLRLPSTSPIPTPQFRGLDERLRAWREALAPFLSLTS